RWLGEPVLAAALAGALAIVLWVWTVHRAVAPAVSLFRAIAGTATSYRDGDFSTSLHWNGRDELGDLVNAHNELGAALRDERLSLVQRELLLDTMVQHTPVAMLLTDAGGRIVYGNLAARHLLHGGSRLEGASLGDLLASCPEPMRDAIDRGGDGLFTVGSGEEDEEIFHLARRGFRLNARTHELLLIRHVTAELRRQEVRTWKKVIRVISHELNNSLGPVASLAQSGGELVRRGKTERLEQVFATIEERAGHLDAFIRGYAQFAKLPAPRIEVVSWARFLERLRSQVDFAFEPPPADRTGRFDPGQLEQAVLNLVKNAQESGSPPDAIEVRVRHLPGFVRLEVLDRGSGMPESALENALVPFYSTKRTGTGLGLALAREIAEAHGGRIALANREGGGLVVTITLPD
ncbi:MAG TPA: ATP-binding protein, partial [Kofleriaceae bacterium]|nr:ATP-binding protein [Kofleriaceae bacterium]